MSDEPITLVFDAPGPDSRGYLRRTERALHFYETLADKQNFTSATINAIVEFLADYVIQPADRAAAIEALKDASQNEFLAMLQSVTGKQSDVPLASGSTTATGFKDTGSPRPAGHSSLKPHTNGTSRPGKSSKTVASVGGRPG